MIYNPSILLILKVQEHQKIRWADNNFQLKITNNFKQKRKESLWNSMASVSRKKVIQSHQVNPVLR